MTMQRMDVWFPVHETGNTCHGKKNFFSKRQCNGLFFCTRLILLVEMEMCVLEQQVYKRDPVCLVSHLVSNVNMSTVIENKIELLNIEYVVFAKFMQWNKMDIPIVICMVSTLDPKHVECIYIDYKQDIPVSRKFWKIYNRNLQSILCKQPEKKQWISFKGLRAWLTSFVNHDSDGWPTLFATSGHRQINFFKSYWPQVTNIRFQQKMFPCTCVRCESTWCAHFIQKIQIEAAWHMNGCVV